VYKIRVSIIGIGEAKIVTGAGTARPGSDYLWFVSSRAQLYINQVNTSFGKNRAIPPTADRQVVFPGNIL
jgi:hypothetical protein